MRTLTFTLIFFFLVVNTQFLYQHFTSNHFIFSISLFLLMFTAWCVLVCVNFAQFIILLTEKFRNVHRIGVLVLGSSVLTLAAYYPVGIISSNHLDTASLFNASREGAANCRTTLSLTDRHDFRYTEVCFRKESASGSYVKSADTIFFTSNDDSYLEFNYGVIQMKDMTHNSPILGRLNLYKKDSLINFLWITQNDF